MYLDIQESELQNIYEDILTILGAFTIDVDITKQEVLIVLRRALTEFEKETSMWQLLNQFGNAYGQVQGAVITNQLATMNFSIVNQITDWFASMAHSGGKIPWHKDYITLEPGRQIYDLSKESSRPYVPGTRRIHRVMWVARPEIFNSGQFVGNLNVNGDDVLYSNNFNFSANGMNFGNSPLAFLGYSFDTLLLMQSAQMRNKILFSEFSHTLSGDILEITPMPGGFTSGGNTGIAPNSKVFYYFFAESEVNLNGPDPNFNMNSSTVSGSIGNPVGMPPGTSSLIANPIDLNLQYTTWSGLSPWAQTWIWEFALARCKYIQGAKWRKIKKNFSTGEMSYEIEFDYQSLLNEAQEEMNNLRANLREDLRAMSLAKILEDKASQVESATKISSRVPRLWTFG